MPYIWRRIFHLKLLYSRINIEAWGNVNFLHVSFICGVSKDAVLKPGRGADSCLLSLAARAGSGHWGRQGPCRLLLLQVLRWRKSNTSTPLVGLISALLLGSLPLLMYAFT